MKILLVQPNSRYCFNGPVFSQVPHGLLYVAAALREAGFPAVGLLDARAERLSRRQLAARIREFAPRVVGITGMSNDAGEVHAAAALARKNAPGCAVVVGGPYATSSPGEAVADPNVDFVVLGEGERTACELVSALARGEGTDGIAGLVRSGPGGPVFGPPREMLKPGELPVPAWDLAGLEKYFGLWTRHSLNPFPKSERIVPLFTSRGCPYRCVYCHDIFGKVPRLRSAEDVLDELETLVRRHGAGEVEIVDDIFNIDLARAKRICDGIVDRGLKVSLSFPNGLRADRMDEELVLKLKRAGTHLIFYAVESASPRVQALIRKDLDLEKTARMVRFTAAQGITTGGFFMLGFPGETREEMEATIGFATAQPFHLASFFFVTPRPGTELYTMAGGGLPEAAGKGSYFRFSVNLSAVPALELVGMVRKANEAFYRRPRQLLRLLRAIPNKRYVLKVLLRSFFLRNWA